jgi:hypothetical protein
MQTMNFMFAIKYYETKCRMLKFEEKKAIDMYSISTIYSKALRSHYDCACTRTV